MTTYDFYAAREEIQENAQFMADYELGIRDLSSHFNLKKQEEQKKKNAQYQKNQDRGVTKEVNPNTAKDELKKVAVELNAKIPQGFRPLDFCPDLVGKVLPSPTSIGLLFSWTLKTPFFSRAIAEFSAIDNPVSRDRLTGIPVLHAAGAKGMLRAAFRSYAEGAENVLEQEKYLFGNDREIKNQEDAEAAVVIAGDVFFKPTTNEKYKTKTELFSPHFRKSRTVDKPIGFEMVGSGGTVEWGVLLFDFTYEPERIFESVIPVLYSVRDLITVFGMSAKRSSGYGVGENLKVNFNFTDQVKGKLPNTIKPSMSMKDAMPIEDAIKHFGGE